MVNIRRWKIEYFETAAGVQPGELFENSLDSSSNRDEQRIAGKLIRVAEMVGEEENFSDLTVNGP